MPPPIDRNRPVTQPRTTTPTPTQQQQQQEQNKVVNTRGQATVAEASYEYGYSTGSAFEASTTGNIGGFDTEAHVNGPSFSVDGHADASIGMDGIDVSLSVHVNATLVEAGASATRTFTIDVAGEQLEVTVDLSAEGMVGADGSINLDIHIGTDGQVSISAGADGFAGAKASLTGSISVTHEGRDIASGSIELSATAGVGFDAHADIDLGLDGLSFDVGAEVTAGFGFGVDISGNINAGNTLRFVGEALAGLVEEGIEWAGDRLEDVADWAGDRLEDVGEFIDDLIPEGGFIDDDVPILGWL